jgi:hypothetical protein
MTTEQVPDAVRRALNRLLADVLIYARAAVSSLRGVTPERSVELNRLFNLVHNVPSFIDGTYPLGFDESWFRRALHEFDQRNGTDFAGVYQSERDAFSPKPSPAAPHFLELLEVIARLPALPAEVLEEHYNAVAFGSWWVTLRYRGLPLRVSFDGKESCYRLDRASRGRPADFEPFWEQRTGSRSSPTDLINVIREAGYCNFGLKQTRASLALDPRS